MRGSVLSILGAVTACAASRLTPDGTLESRATPTSYPTVITPKVFIIDAFEPEGNSWYGIPQFDLLAHNISIPGFSPLYPEAHCTASGDICQVVTGESEINAAVTITSLVFSSAFDLTKTYFLLAGIAGVNPEVATLGGVSFARYTVQVALQYEFDARQIPANFSTGYVPQGAYAPGQYPQSIYGTEVFEVNDNLRRMAAGFARKANLSDSAAAIKYRAHYGTTPAFKAATKKPSVVLCDSATSDVYYSGSLLSEAFGRYITLVTNGTGEYCATAQEDSGISEALLRGALANRVDFSRLILMRTLSDFDRPYKGEADTVNLFYANQGGFDPAIANIRRAGVKVVEGIVQGWGSTFEQGVKPDNYIGDILDSLKGPYPPNFGLPSAFINKRSDAQEAAMQGVRPVKRSSSGKWRGPVMRIAAP